MLGDSIEDMELAVKEIEAAGALIDYAFNHLKLQRINTFYSAKNLTVAKLAYSLGFSYNSEKQPLDENQQLQYIERQ